MTALLTTAGEQHGLLNTLANSVPFDDFKHMKPETKSKCEKLKKEESRKVRARYINHRGQHERLSMPYCRWSGEPIQMWHFIPNHVYEVPMGLINQVNDSAKRIPQRADLISRDGQNVTSDGSPTRKDLPGEIIHEFVPVNF